MKYRNLEEPYVPNSFRSVLKWAVWDRVWGKRVPAPKRVLMPRAEPDPGLFTSDGVALFWVGHASWIARVGGLNVFIDPVWAPSLGGLVERNAPPGIALEQAPRPDVVLVTHNHRDHLDAWTIDRLDKAATVVAPAGLGAFFRKKGFANVVELEWWGQCEVGGVKVAFVPSQHWSRRGVFDGNDSLWGGFVVEGGGKRVYHSGDTAWFGGFEEIGKRFPGIDAAMLPIGAYEPEWFMRRQHMNPEDAMKAFVALGARLLCAMHWGTFKLTDEPLDQPPRELEQWRAKLGVERERVWVPAIGEGRRI